MPTLHASEKTDPGMLPQSQALESTSADNPGVGTKRGVDTGRATGRATGVQHGRGETPVGLTNQQERRPSSPEQSGGEGDRGLAAPPSSTAARVFVVDRHGNPLMPCHPARARKLLASGRARVHRSAPFVIRLVDRTTADSVVTGVEVGIDPGSKFTGISVFQTTPAGRVGLVSIEVRHRGQLIHKKLQQRSGYRRGRRSRNLRYRPPRFDNRTRPKGWLAPSLRHRVDTTTSMVARLRRWAPVVALHQELVRFDMQKLENPEITGVEYQRGTLAGNETREYLLAKWNRTCAYCGATGVVLNIDHIRPKANGGSNRVSNLALACIPCNQSKGKTRLEAWLATRFGPTKAATIAKRILAHAKAPLKDAAAVNATRWALYRALAATGLPVETSSGGRTKWNRSRFGVPKTHTLDAICVGGAAGIVSYPSQATIARANGQGSYQRTRIVTARPCRHCGKTFYRSMEELLATKTRPERARSRCCPACRSAGTTSDGGYRCKAAPVRHFPRTKTAHGFQTGDLVRAVVPAGKYTGAHAGRVAVRSSGSFNITTTAGKVQGINYRHCTILQRSDGWGWSRQPEGVINAA